MSDLSNSTPNYITHNSINDHIKINIEQSAKGARVIVTLDRSDHDINKAVEQAIEIYQKSIQGLKNRSLKVDDGGVKE